MKSADMLRIMTKHAPVTTLGPGRRAVIWVQGCSKACPGCIAPEGWDYSAGDVDTVDSLSAWLLGLNGIDGLTLSGGEPMDQADALYELVEDARDKIDLSVMLYTGYVLEHLRENGIAAQKRLLGAIDILVDGPYVIGWHADLLWRGSANQRIHCLTPRYAQEISTRLQNDDRSAGVEIAVLGRDAFTFAGVPAAIDFREKFGNKMRQYGLVKQGTNKETST